jgi:hypothetical protein
LTDVSELQTTRFNNLRVTFKEAFGTLRPERVSNWPNSLSLWQMTMKTKMKYQEDVENYVITYLSARVGKEE